VPAIPGVSDLTILGAGGFGTVFAGVDCERREVAVKVAHRRRDPRFAREAQALRAIGPPATAALYATGTTTDGRSYLVEERLRGRTLADWLAELPGAGAASPAEVAPLCAALCQALTAVHSVGIVHRDLKPENVFLRAPAERCEIALLDFGLARPIGAGPERTPLDLTKTGQQLGSTHYLAPEQLADPRKVDERADLYALGAILYECLAGRPPFLGDDAAVRHAHVARRPAPPSQWECAAVALDAVVLRCLAKDPARRFASAAELAAAFAAALLAPVEPLAAPSPAGQPRDAHRMVGLLGVRSSLAVPEITAAVEDEGGHLVRARDDGYLFVFPEPSVRAAVEAGLRASRALLPRLGSGDRMVLHAAAVRVRETSRGVLAIGAALEAPAWWMGDDGDVLTTPVAAALLDGERSNPVTTDDGSSEAAPRVPDLVGRDDVLENLIDEAEKAFHDEAPVLSTIVGEVGYGKSRLLDAVVGQLGGARILRVRFGAPESAGNDSPADLLWRTAAGDAGGALPATRSREDLARAIADALRPPAGQPTALLVDDAQWADPSALDALELAATSGGSPLWIAVATSPELLERRPLWGDRALFRSEHLLEALDAGAERALLCQLLQPAEFIPEDLLAALQERTCGVPLFAVEIAHALRAGGALRRSDGDGGYYLAGDELLRVSSTPLAARLAEHLLRRAPPALRAFAELCAVLGDGFSRTDAFLAERAVSTADETGEPLDPDVALDRLRRTGVLSPDRDGHWLFRHPLLRAAIEEAIPAARRRELHRLVLAARSSRGGVSPAVIARHAERCGDHEKAFTNHFLLAEEARAAHHYLDADDHYTAALTHLPDSDARRGAVLAGRAKVRYRVQRFSDALDDLHASRAHAEAAGDERAAADLLLEEATIEDWRESWAASGALVAQAKPLVERSGDAALRARWLMALGRTRFREEQLAEAVRDLGAGQSLAREVGDHETWAIASMLLGTTLVSTGRLDEAEEQFATVIESCERANDTLHLCSAYNNRIWLWFKRESLERAVLDQRRATELARQIAHVQLERSCTYNLAELLYWRGELGEALGLARRARELQTRFLDDVPLDALLVARISAALGDLPVVRRELAWVQERCPPDRRPPLVRTHVRLLELLVAGRAPGTSASWRALVEEARGTSVLYELHEVLLFAATAALREGRADDGRRYLEEGARLAGPSDVWRERFSQLGDDQDLTPALR
jgi:tRNA A-37 threonylcarbamoyl transferase component Bud32/tetratricopeptide (TPR) repeat protein